MPSCKYVSKRTGINTAQGGRAETYTTSTYEPGQPFNMYWHLQTTWDAYAEDSEISCEVVKP